MKLTHLLLAAVLGAGACVTTAYAGDYIENQVSIKIQIITLT